MRCDHCSAVYCRSSAFVTTRSPGRIPETISCRSGITIWPLYYFNATERMTTLRHIHPVPVVKMQDGGGRHQRADFLRWTVKSGGHEHTEAKNTRSSRLPNEPSPCEWQDRESGRYC